MTGPRWLILTAVAVAAIQIGFLASMIVGRAAILRDGSEVVLEVQPVDPRDLLRGDYVRLGYNISSIPAGILVEKPSESRGAEERTIFVRLKAGADGIWQPVSARFDTKPEPAAGDGEVDIRGLASGTLLDAAATIGVDYGIERFYVPEGEGKAIEADLGVRSFRMKVAVADSGTAQIKSLHDGETMLYGEPIY